MGYLAPQGTSGHVWMHFWLAQLRERDANGIWWVEIRDAAKYPTVHEIGPITKN